MRRNSPFESIDAAEKERDSLAQRLANPNFTERAKPEAVEKARADHEAKAAEAERCVRRWSGWDSTPVIPAKAGAQEPGPAFFSECGTRSPGSSPG